MVSRILAADVGGSSVKLGAVLAGSPPRIVASDTVRGHREEFTRAVAVIATRLEELAREAGWESAEGMGLGLPGLVQGREGVLREAPNLHAWDGHNVARAFAERLGLPVRIDNDANAFALAEWLWGAGRGGRDVVFLTLGTGIGGGLVSSGRMVRGMSGFASEPGHILISPRGLRLGGEIPDEAERYVGIRGIVERAARHPGYESDPRLPALEELTPVSLYAAAENGSRVAAEIWEDVGAGLGELLVTLVNLLNPERIVLGGGVAQAGRWIFDPARAYLERYGLVARHAPPQIMPAALGPEAGLLGAAGLLVETEGPPTPP